MPKAKPTLKDLSGLKQAVNGVAKELKDAAASLLTEIEFLHVTLTKLKKSIDEDGPVIESSRGTRENPALKAYNTSIMRYSQLLKQLTDMLPEPPKQQAIDPLIDFITS